MKKIITLSLVAVFALGASAKISPNAMKVYTPQDAQMEKINPTATASSEKAKALEFSMVGKKAVVKNLELTDDATNIPGTAYARPAGSFYCAYSSNFYSFNNNRSYMPPFSTLTFANATTEGSSYLWNYTDLIDGETELTSTETDLTVNSLGYDFLAMPSLTATNELGDSTFQISPYMQIGGACYSSDAGGFFGATNYSKNWIGFTYHSLYTGIKNARADSYYTQQLAQYGVDTVQVVGYAEYNDKPASPYILSDVSVLMVCPVAGDLTLKIYKAVEENGVLSLGDLLSEATTTVEASNNITSAVFSDLLYSDPESGLEETLIIDDAIICVVEGDIQNYPLYRRHYENLPNEKHAYNVIRYEYNGEEITDLTSFNYHWTDGMYNSAFTFSYNIAQYYLHNNEDSDTYNAPAEGGEKTFSVSSYYASGAWDITTPDYDDVPEWITVEPTDGRVVQDGTAYYTGDTDVKLTVEALPEGVESRSADIMLSYDGAKLILHVAQPGDQGGLVGDVNQDGAVNGADVTALYNYILNGDTTFIATSDVNGDGAINGGDVTAVYNIILGL